MIFCYCAILNIIFLMPCILHIVVVFDEPEPSVTGSLSHPDATTTEWVTVISRNSKDSLEAATISTHNPSTANFLLMLSESSSFSIRSSYSNLNNSHLPNSSSNSGLFHELDLHFT